MMMDGHQKKLKLGIKDAASIVGLVLILGISCYYLFLLSGKYYSPLSDFFAFKQDAESLLSLSLPVSKRTPLFSLLMGLVSLLIPVKKAILWAGILLSNFTYIGSIVLIYKISQQIGIKHSFVVSWFFAFSSLSLYCATQPLPESTILFLILLSFYVTNDRLSISISGLAAFTRFDGAFAALAKLPKILKEKKWRLIVLTILVLLPSVMWVVFVGKGGYIRAVLYHEQFVINKVAGNFISLLRTLTLSYFPADHWASVPGDSQFHTSWWVQLVWIINIFIILIGLFHLIKLNKPNHWKLPAFFLMYLFFLWFYYWTTWRFFYFVGWMFPFFTIAGIEYLLMRWEHQKQRVQKKIVVSMLGILGMIVVYYLYSTPFLKKLYLEYFSLNFELNSLKRLLIFLPICVFAFLKARQLKSKGYLVLLPLFLLITPLVFSHITAINNWYGGLWDLKVGLEVVKSRVKNEELILMPDKMVNCATYLSGIPEKNIVTYDPEGLFVNDLKYIASYRSWDKDPILKQLENHPKRISIKDQEVDVTEIYRVGIFRLFQLISVIPDKDDNTFY